MLRALSVVPDPILAEQLAAQVRDLPDVQLTRVSAAYPSLEALLQAIRVDRPDFLFAFVGDVGQLEELLTALDGLANGTPVIALGSELNADVALRLMHLGVREYLTFPLDSAKFAAAMASIRSHFAKHPTPARSQAFYSFLPAKPGVGCSTIAVAAASVLANDLGVRTLLIDGDLYSGPIQFLLRLQAAGSLPEAMSHAERLDEDLWRQMISRSDALDVLHAGDHMPPATLSGDGLGTVLNIARALYDVVCVDLPSALDPISLTFLEESRRVFLVTGGDLAEMHFARIRARQLAERGLKDRVSLVLNHTHHAKDLLSNAQIEETVGLPISFTFPNAHRDIQHAVLNGAPVSHEKTISEAVQALTHFMLPNPSGGPPPHRIGPKFLEFFRVLRAPEADLPGRVH